MLKNVGLYNREQPIDVKIELVSSTARATNYGSAMANRYESPSYGRNYFAWFGSPAATDYAGLFCLGISLQPPGAHGGEFLFTYYRAGTNEELELDRLYLTFYDLDGEASDADNLQEIIAIPEAENIQLSAVTDVTVGIFPDVGIQYGLGERSNNPHLPSDARNPEEAAWPAMAAYDIRGRSKVHVLLGGTAGRQGSTRGFCFSHYMTSMPFNCPPSSPPPVPVPTTPLEGRRHLSHGRRRIEMTEDWFKVSHSWSGIAP
eukprot:5167200-Prymnesium_polylepis.1